MTMYSSGRKNRTRNPMNRILWEIRAWSTHLEREDLESELAMLKKPEKYYSDANAAEVEHATKVVERVLAL